MRHRIGGGITGFGNPDKELLGNTGNLTPLVKKMAGEAVGLYFKKWGGCDFEIKENYVKLGIEPAYQRERLKVVVVCRDKGRSYFREGYAFGMYGSQIVSSYRFYWQCKRNGKFKKFVDRWHGKLFK